MKNFSSRLFTLMVFVFVLLSLSSCLHYVYVSSSTFSDQRAIPCGFAYGSKFFVKSANKDAKLLEKEVIYKIENILKSLGYDVVRDVKIADYCLVFNLGIEGVKCSRSVPVYQPGETSIKRGYTHTDGHKCQGLGCSSCVNNGKNKSECVEYEETITTPGKYIYVKEDYIDYHKDLHIEVYDANLYRLTKKQEILWSGTSHKACESGDLRVYLDYLLVSVFKFFGISTKRDISMSISDKEMQEQRAFFGLF